MANEDSTVWVVFNGEIYNHAELRRSLESKGHRFRGSSDTEVIPHLYEDDPEGFVNRLRGMFAFALFDSQRARLVLARDRFGIKPLFYAASAQRLFFASELNALRVFPGVSGEPDPQALADFFALGFIPAPLTWFQGVNNLEPGELIEAQWGDGSIQCGKRRFHNFQIRPGWNLDFDETLDRADDLLHAAVARQLESDVPLGCLLSGGIDSSLVSGAAKKASGSLHTFNVRFPDPEYDETWAAQLAARAIGSDHTTLALGQGKGTWEGIKESILGCGQPFGDTSIFAVNEICREMKNHVTVALSGDGGDEAFGGYGLYWRLRRAMRWRRVPTWLQSCLGWGSGIASSMRFLPEHLPERLREMGRTDDIGLIQGIYCKMNEQALSQLVRGAEKFLPARRHFEPRWNTDSDCEGSRWHRLSGLITEVSTRLILPNDFLFKVDSGSMRASLEIRVPLLDEELFDFGLQLPLEMKEKGREFKRVLRALARRRFPPEVADKPKMGFGIPVDRWTTSEVRLRLQEVVCSKRSPLSEFLDPGEYRPRIDAFVHDNDLPKSARSLLCRNAIMLLGAHLFLTEGHVSTA
jgi:asparagine synthase (glutamine-hydrolysing)